MAKPISTQALGRASWRALCVVGLLVSAVASTEAASVPQPAAQSATQTVTRDAKSDAEADFARLDDNKRLRILIKMIKAGYPDQAARLLATVPFTGPLAENRTLFVEGLIDKARGDYPASAEKFRTVLAHNPELSLVRAELAQSLYMMDDDDAARHHLDLLIGSAPTPELARTFDNFIDAIDARRPWNVQAYLTLAPSTNFNSGSSHDTVLVNGVPFTIDEPSRKKSGLGVAGGLNASYRYKLTDELSVVAGAGVNFRQYKGDAFDDIVVAQNLTLERNTGRTRIGFGVRANQIWSHFPEYQLDTSRWITRDNFVFAIGPVLSVTHRFTNALALYSRFRMTWNDDSKHGYLDGTAYDNDNRLSFTVAEATVLYALNGFSRITTKRDHLDNWAFYGGLAFYKEFPWGLTVYSEARATRRVYDSKYPGYYEARKDHRFDFSATLTKRDFDFYGFAPQLQYEYVNQSSNIPFDDFDAHSANITLTKAF